MKLSKLAVGLVLAVMAYPAFANDPSMMNTTPNTNSNNNSEGRQKFVKKRIIHLRGKRTQEARIRRMDDYLDSGGLSDSYRISKAARRQRLIDEAELLMLHKEQNGGRLGPKNQQRLNQDIHRLKTGNY